MTERIERKATNHLRAILQAATDLIDEVGIPHNSDDLYHGPRIRQIAFCECVRRAGEAVAQIDALDPAWLPDRFPDVPWRDVKATRNFLTHHYWTVDYGILHRIATVHLPAVTAPISSYLGAPDPYADGIRTDHPPVRMANRGDVAAIERCVQQAYMSYVERIGQEPAPMLDDYRERVDRNVVHVIDDDEGGIVGLIVMWREADHLYIDNIAVDPRSQGRRLGTRLLEHAEREALAAGLPELRLYTNEAMTENLDFYTKRGFEETHRAIDDAYRRVYFRRTV